MGYKPFALGQLQFASGIINITISHSHYDTLWIWIQTLLTSCQWMDKWSVTAGMNQVCVVCNLRRMCDVMRVNLSSYYLRPTLIHTYQQSSRRRCTQGRSVSLEWTTCGLNSPYVTSSPAPKQVTIKPLWVHSSSNRWHDLCGCNSLFMLDVAESEADWTNNPLLHRLWWF